VNEEFSMRASEIMMSPAVATTPDTPVREAVAPLGRKPAAT
jgi:hypothetical protein